MGSLRTDAETAASAIRGAFAQWAEPVVFLQVGGSFAIDALLDRELGVLDLAELPGMPAAAPASARPFRLLLGVCGSVQVLVAHGRVHVFDGYGAAACALPVCAAALCGIRRAVFIGAAAAVREDLKPGTWVALVDMINNLGTSPLVGNPELAAELHPDMSRAFSQELYAGLLNAAADCGMNPRYGIYQANTGPQFETPIEVEAALRNGADVLGMGLVPETIAAHALGMQVAALVLVTNRAASYHARPLRHADVREACTFMSPAIMRSLRSFLGTELAPAPPLLTTARAAGGES